MSEPRWPRFNREQQRVKWMHIVLDGLADDHLSTLLRIAGESSRPLEEGAGIAVADGFPASSMGGGSTPEGMVPRPTEDSALRYYRTDEDGNFVEWLDPVDNVQQACTELFAQLAEAEGVLNKVNRLRDFVINNGATLRGRVSSLQGDCVDCKRPVPGTPNDRLRSGLCSGCYAAWTRSGRPERAPWLAQRKKDRAAENVHREQTAER